MIKKQKLVFFLMTLLLLIPWGISAHAESSNQKQFIYDGAELLTKKEVAELEALTRERSKERNTAFIIITVKDTKGKTVVQYMEDFYDDEAPGYNKPHGNTAILILDMKKRDVYLAGFKKAEKYLDSDRLDQIRNQITPDLSDGAYFEAFSDFITTSHEYMGYEPGVNPENILFKLWFQLTVSIIAAGVIVGIMAYQSGGTVTVNAETYMNSKQSSVIEQHDNYVRQTVTKVKQSSDNSGSGGGGGTTSGGHSYSGSGGKF